MNLKTTLRHLSLNAQAAWHGQVEEQLKHLHGLTAITAADVVLEHRPEAKPAFRVQMRLEFPGPGPHAQATCHTRQAALLISGRPETGPQPPRNGRIGTWDSQDSSWGEHPIAPRRFPAVYLRL